MMRTPGNAKLRMAILAMMLSLGGAVLAQQKSIQLPADNSVSQLKPGTGVNLANLNCAICHSLDYIVRQPPMNAAQWDAEVRKMITVYGAPINDADAKIIAAYLAANYGPPATAAAAAAGPAAAPARPGN
jgi:sulfite dehydrogenase (cytochrome) subunit B